MQNITIIGGTDGFGKWLAKFLLTNFPGKINLTVTGRNEEKGKNLASEIGCTFSLNNIESVKNSDITIFAVPIAFMENSIKEICPYLKENSVVLDICSIKTFSSEAMQKHSPKSVLVIPTHPMFGPFVSSIAGQITVLTPEKEAKTNEKYIFLKKMLQDFGAKVIEEKASEHDKMMALVQGLTHFDFFVFAETIKRLGVDIEKSMNFVSPVYRLMISSVARYMNQNPKLYSDIQMFNPEVLKVHKVFREVASDFSSFVCNKEKNKFLETINETQRYFGENAKKGQVYTDKIIFMLSGQIDILKKNIGKEIFLENIYGGKKISGILKEFNNESLFLNTGESFLIDEWKIS